MLNISVLNDTLKDFDYYVKKLPTFLRQSAGFIEHYRIWYDVLVGKKDELNNTGVVGSADTLFNLLNIFNLGNDEESNYLDYVITLEDAWDEDASQQDKEAHPYGTKSDILDKIGALFGVNRAFDVTYTLQGETVTSHLVLDNEEFLILIKSQIIKNYCDGTFEQIREYYLSIGLNVLVLTSSQPATSNLYLVTFSNDTNKYTASQNVQAMFLSGLLTISSMGIAYRHNFINMDVLLIWDRETSEWGWGEDVIIDGKLTTTGGQWIV